MSQTNPNTTRLSEEKSDLGFGKAFSGKQGQLINPDGSFNIKRVGYSGKSWFKLLIDMPWAHFLAFIFVYYTLANLLFAILFYLLDPSKIAGIEMGNPLDEFIQCYFFSVQTMTTIGYGGMHPKGYMVSAFAGIEALTGLLTFAIITGLVYAKFSKPKANILFSLNSLYTPLKGFQSLQMRTANAMNNKIIDLQATMILSYIPSDLPNVPKLFRTATLEIERISLFPLNWTIVHVIDEKSPIYGYSLEELRKMRFEFLVFLRGHDESYNQQISAMKSYTVDDLILNAKFEPMFEPGDDTTYIYLDKINNYYFLD